MRDILEISWYLTLVCCGLIAIWFTVRIAYLCLSKKMGFEDAAETTIESLTRFIKKLEQLSKEIQKSQMKSLNSEFDLYILYYKTIIKCWMYQHGLL